MEQLFPKEKSWKQLVSEVVSSRCPDATPFPVPHLITDIIILNPFC